MDDLVPRFASLRESIGLVPSSARAMQEALVELISDFQNDLADDQEVGALFGNFGQPVTITLTEIGRLGQDLTIFYGVTPDGKEVKVLQHQSQVNLMLVPVVITDGPARRVGFGV